MGEDHKEIAKQRQSQVAPGAEKPLDSGHLVWHRAQTIARMDEFIMCDLPLWSQFRSRVHLNMPRLMPTLRGNSTVTGCASAKCSRFSTQCCPGLSLSLLDRLIEITQRPILNPSSAADRRLICSNRSVSIERMIQQNRAGSAVMEYQSTSNFVRPAPILVYLYIYIYTPNPSVLRLGDDKTSYASATKKTFYLLDTELIPSLKSNLDLKSGQYSDMTLRCGSSEFHVHRAHMCPRSACFRTGIDNPISRLRRQSPINSSGNFTTWQDIGQESPLVCPSRQRPPHDLYWSGFRHRRLAAWL